MSWREKIQRFASTQFQLGGEILAKKNKSSTDDYVIVSNSQPDESGFVASLALLESGCINLFANTTTGMRADPTTNAVVLMGEALRINADTVEINCRPDGFRVNGQIVDLSCQHEVPNTPGVIIVPGTVKDPIQSSVVQAERMQRALRLFSSVLPEVYW